MTPYGRWGGGVGTGRGWNNKSRATENHIDCLINGHSSVHSQRHKFTSNAIKNLQNGINRPKMQLVSRELMPRIHAINS